MIDRNPDNRPSAEEILNDEWLQHGIATDTETTEEMKSRWPATILLSEDSPVTYSQIS